MAYKHGIYSDLIPSKDVIGVARGTIPFYIGTAPVHRAGDTTGAINKPLLIKTIDDAVSKLGYSSNDDFEEYTLSAVVYGHFQNTIKPIGPVIVVNVADPKVHKTELTEDITLDNGKATLDERAITDSVSIPLKELNVDYTLERAEDGSLILTDTGTLGSPVSVTYSKFDTSLAVESDIVGSYDNTTDKRTGLNTLQTVYEDLNLVPSVLSAPGYNHKKTVHDALIAASIKFGGRWNATVATDVDSVAAKTISEAMSWCESNGYKSVREKVHFPRVKSGNRVIWLSIMSIVRMQQTDTDNGGIPYESPSNKPLGIEGLVVGDGTEELQINIIKGNELNEKGLTTAIKNGGNWVLWGPHNANYKYGDEIRAEEIFDSNIRMNYYMLNNFIIRNLSLIDGPMTRNDIDALLNSEQLRLNSLISDGKLLYGSINFNPDSNPTGDLIQGDFSFDTLVTNVVPAKSITNRIQNTTKGLEALSGGES